MGWHQSPLSNIDFNKLQYTTASSSLPLYVGTAGMHLSMHVRSQETWLSWSRRVKMADAGDLLY